jgi:uncharacterized protein YjlB
MLQLIRLEERGAMPNNPRLPVLLYQCVFAPAEGDLAAAMEARFAANGWPPQWRNGIHDFDHYHLAGHEVLGFAAGTARLCLGGEGGREIDVSAGDVLLLPAGTGHRRLSASRDLLVVGAYPPGQQGDIRRDAASPEQKAGMARLTFPPRDPVLGEGGPTTQHWSAS